MILIVDDDPAQRRMTGALLTATRRAWREVASGREALELLQGEEGGAVTLVLLDLAMPGLDGRQVLSQIRGSVDTAALPVLIRTGTGSDRIEAELLEAGADDYVEKSVDADRFMARVHAVLRRAM